MNYGKTMRVQQNCDRSLVCFLLVFLVLQVSLLLLGMNPQSRLSVPRKWTHSWETVISEFEMNLAGSILWEKGETEQTGTYVVRRESQKQESSGVYVNSAYFLHNPLFLSVSVKMKNINHGLL